MVRRQADLQRRWALEWSGVTIATPYRSLSAKPTNRLFRVFRRCRWVLGDPATWRDLLWTLVNVPVSVALANVVKHSGANRAWVQLEYDHDRLVAIIGDNGAGGAHPRTGGGLQGIERGLNAFDGMVAVTSPAGGPTQVTMELPCELSSART